MATPLRWLFVATLLLAGVAAAQPTGRDAVPARPALEPSVLTAVPARTAPRAQQNGSSRRFDPSGEDRVLSTLPVVRRRAVAVVVFHGGQREGQGRLAPPAQPVFVGVSLRAGAEAKD